MTPERYRRIRAVLDRRQPDLTVLLDNVHKPHNLAAILRSCDAVGVLEVHCVWPDPTIRPSQHTSGGSSRWVGVRTHRLLSRAVEQLRAARFTICAAHVSSHATDYRSLDYTKPTAILVGAELGGLSSLAIELSDEHIAIPMAGMVHSLNVSVATAIILFEAQRQRAGAGMYDTCRLPGEEYARTLFEWLHPQVAMHCRERGLPYPALDECGEIVDFSLRDRR